MNSLKIPAQKAFVRHARIVLDEVVTKAGNGLSQNGFELQQGESAYRVISKASIFSVSEEVTEAEAAEFAKDLIMIGLPDRLATLFPDLTGWEWPTDCGEDGQLVLVRSWS